MIKKRTYTYDPFRPDEINNLRQRKSTLTTALKSKKCNERYCEHCKQIKLSNGKPHVKGWKCSDCQQKEARNEQL